MGTPSIDANVPTSSSKLLNVIVTIEIKNNKYIVEWENKENLEKGIDEVDKKGNVKMIEAEIE